MTLKRLQQQVVYILILSAIPLDMVITALETAKSDYVAWKEGWRALFK